MQLLSSGGQLCYSVSGIWQISHYYPQMSFRFNSAGVERMGTICFHFKMTKKKKASSKSTYKDLALSLLWTDYSVKTLSMSAAL